MIKTCNDCPRYTGIVNQYDIPISDPLIVMGNGPSLNSIDFNILRNKDTFGLKDYFVMYTGLNWYPKYFGCFDEPWLENKDNIKRLREFIESNPPIYKFAFPCEYYFKLISKKLVNRNICFPIYRKEKETVITINGGSSALSAAKMGIALGYKKIIFVGVDCTYGQTKSNNYDNNLITTSVDLVTDYPGFTSHEELHKHLNSSHQEDFLLLRKMYPEIDFVNCGGELSKLDCFRRGKLHDEL